jgi:glycerol-3-phosphate dehydrogenase
MIGGKLSSYRLFAEQMADVAVARLGRGTPCRTATTPLPGAAPAVEVAPLARLGGFDPVSATRLAYRHGVRAMAIAERAAADPRGAEVVCACEPVTLAEIHHVVDHELARTVDDVARRTRLGLGSCGGMRCAARCGAVVAGLTGRSPLEGQRQAREFLELAARRRLPAMGPDQARQELLLRASWRAELGLGRP